MQKTKHMQTHTATYMYIQYPSAYRHKIYMKMKQTGGKLTPRSSGERRRDMVLMGSRSEVREVARMSDPWRPEAG